MQAAAKPLSSSEKAFAQFLREKAQESLRRRFLAVQVVLDGQTEAVLQPGLQRIAERYSSLSTLQGLRMKLDRWTLRLINLQDLLGFDKALQFIRQIQEHCYTFIAEEEPPAVLHGLLQSHAGFLLLIGCCYDDYISRILHSRFPFLKELAAERREMIVEQVKATIGEQYEHFREYQPQRARFKSFLFPHIRFALYRVLQAEGLEQRSYRVSNKLHALWISENNPDLAAVLEALRGEPAFSTLREALDWFRQQLGDHDFATRETAIRQHLKTAILYREPQDISQTSDEHLPAGEAGRSMPDFSDMDLKPAHFLWHTLKFIESDPLHRLILKISLGLPINYCNDELHEIIHPAEVSLRLVGRLQELLDIQESGNQSRTLRALQHFFAPWSEALRQNSPGALQKRITRNFQKIRQSIPQAPFRSLIDSIHQSFRIELLQKPPLFLVLARDELAILSEQVEHLQLLRILVCRQAGHSAGFPPEITRLPELQVLKTWERGSLDDEGESISGNNEWD